MAVFRVSRRAALLSAAAIALGLGPTLLPSVSLATTGAGGSGFEDNDGNLTHDSAIDWNDFASATDFSGWANDTNGKPVATATLPASGWSFSGFGDVAKSSSDDSFAGGVKQDDDCGKVSTGSAPNKDDLKRIYLSTRNDNGEVYLNLAWVRIPQNSVTSSAHVGFEFNQADSSKTANQCATGGLVKRSGGDMLFVYDFAGGSTAPQIKLSRWLTTAWVSANQTLQTGTMTCEVGTSTIAKGCWGYTKVISDSGFAEGLVYTGSGPTTDSLKPSGDTDPGMVEFGEAGADLGPNGANVFQSGRCQSFGNAYAVSRSSGNSSQAAMEDIVGPHHFTVTNCGSVRINKVGTIGSTATKPTGSKFTLFANATPTAALTATSTTITGTWTSSSPAAGDDFVATSDPWTPNTAGSAADYYVRIGAEIVRVHRDTAGHLTVGQRGALATAAAGHAASDAAVQLVSGEDQPLVRTTTVSTASTGTTLNVSDLSIFPTVGNYYVVVGGQNYEVSASALVSGGPGGTLTVSPALTGTVAATTAVKWEGSCEPTGTDDTCKVENVLFGKYIAVEAVVPTNYTGVNPQYFEIKSGTTTDQNAVVSVTNTAAPATVTVLKRDDTGNGLIPICGGATDGAMTDGCAKFALALNVSPTDPLSNDTFDPLRFVTGNTTTTTSTAITTITQTSFNVAKALANLPATPFYIDVTDQSDATKTETMRVTAASAVDSTHSALTVDRAVDLSTAQASLPAPSDVRVLSGVDIKQKSCVASATDTGTCTVSSVFPGFYWIVETATPTGFSTAPAKAIEVKLGDSVATGTYTINDTRLFKVIEFVCTAYKDSTHANRLYSGTANLNQTAAGTTSDSASTLASTTDSATIESTICGLDSSSGGAVFTRPANTSTSSTGTDYQYPGSTRIPK